MPEPKKPEIQTPILPVGSGFFPWSTASRYQEMNLRKCWSSSRVMTNSSNSCQTEESSSWSAFTTPLMGRKMSRSKRFLMSMSASIYGTSLKAR